MYGLPVCWVRTTVLTYFHKNKLTRLLVFTTTLYLTATPTAQDCFCLEFKIGEGRKMVSASTGTPAMVTSASRPLRPRSFTRRLIHGILHSSILIKAQLLLAIILLGSLLQAKELVPESVFSDKTNPLNKYLAKYSWLWTLMWVIPTVLITGALYSALITRDFLRHLGRVATAHIVWYGVTTLINKYHHEFGQCEMEDIINIKVCLQGGHRWIGFDISGHVFFMSYCIFIITEEAANIKLEVWNEYSNALSIEYRVVEKAGPQVERWLQNIYRFGSYFVEAMELFGLSLIVLWYCVVIPTSLYFHTFQEKLAGCLIAIVMWWFTYKVVYGTRRYLPCKTTGGVLHPLKHL